MSVINIYRNEALHCRDVLGFTLIQIQSIIDNEWTGRGAQTPDNEAFLNKMEMVFESERLLKRMIKQIDDNVFFSPTPKELKQEKDEANLSILLSMARGRREWGGNQPPSRPGKRRVRW